MEQLVKELEAKMAEFAKNANDQVEKGNKAAGTRARKASLEIEKLGPTIEIMAENELLMAHKYAVSIRNVKK